MADERFTIDDLVEAEKRQRERIHHRLAALEWDSPADRNRALNAARDTDAP